MQARNDITKRMKWIAADATDLTEVLPSDAFSLVIDKGTWDAVCCHKQHALMLAKFLKEACRVTAVGGAYVCISCHPRRDVLRWLRRRAFDWQVRTVDFTCANLDADRYKRNPNYAHGIRAYVCTKRRPSDQALYHWPSLQRRVVEAPDDEVSSEAVIDNEISAEKSACHDLVQEADTGNGRAASTFNLQCMD